MAIGAGGCFFRALCRNLLIRLLFCTFPPAEELGLILLNFQLYSQFLNRIKCPINYKLECSWIRVPWMAGELSGKWGEWNKCANNTNIKCAPCSQNSRVNLLLDQCKLVQTYFRLISLRSKWMNKSSLNYFFRFLAKSQLIKFVCCKQI